MPCYFLSVSFDTRDKFLECSKIVSQSGTKRIVEGTVLNLIHQIRTFAEMTGESLHACPAMTWCDARAKRMIISEARKSTAELPSCRMIRDTISCHYVCSFVFCVPSSPKFLLFMIVSWLAMMIWMLRNRNHDHHLHDQDSLKFPPEEASRLCHSVFHISVRQSEQRWTKGATRDDPLDPVNCIFQHHYRLLFQTDWNTRRLFTTWKFLSLNLSVVDVSRDSDIMSIRLSINNKKTERIPWRDSEKSLI